jgi:hypothetical protein
MAFPLQLAVRIVWKDTLFSRPSNLQEQEIKLPGKEAIITHDPHRMEGPEVRKYRSLYTPWRIQQETPNVRVTEVSGRDMRSQSVGLKAVKQSRAVLCSIAAADGRSCLSFGIEIPNLVGGTPFSPHRVPSKAGMLSEALS